jgi:hypothetical protein
MQNSMNMHDRELRVTAMVVLACMLLGLSQSCADAPDGDAADGGDSDSSMCGGYDAGTVGGPSPVPPAAQPTDAVEGIACNDPSRQKPLTRRDECACNDLTCAPGETCVKADEMAPLAVGGPGYSFNGCFELCADDIDCGPGRSCSTNVYGFRECAPTTCRTDADCDDQRCGICIRGFRGYHGGIKVFDETANRCEYTGPSDAGPAMD